MKRLIITILIVFLSIVTCSWNPPSAKAAGTSAMTKQAVVTESEPNDSRDSATSIKALDSVRGTIQNDADIDYYKLEMPHKGKLTLFSAFDDYYSDELEITLFSGNGTVVSDYNYYNEHQELTATLEKGTYYISVKPKSYFYSQNESYQLWQEVTYLPDFQVSSITANLASPQTERKAISFTANASKTGLDYQFSVQGKVVRAYSKANTYQWTPTSPGKYKIKVEARDPNYQTAVVQKEITYTITAYKPDFTIVSLTPSIKSPYLAGKTITFSTKANKSGLQYQYSVNGRVVQAFGSKTTYSWKATKPGTYKIKVDVRRSQYPNRIVSKQISYQIVDGKVSVSSLQANKKAPMPTSTSITWTTKARGTNLEYQYSIYQNKKWKIIKNYSSKNYVTWKPKSAGTYKVKVTVRSKLSKKTASKTVSYTIFKPSYFSTPTLKSDISKKQPAGKYFYFTAKSSGKYLEYRFRVYNGYYWETVKNYSGSKSLSWKAYYKGKYKVRVDVRQKGTSKVKSKTLSLDIREAPNYYFNANYFIYYNSGYLRVTNYGYSNLKVTKVQLLNNSKVIYTYQPKNWITVGRTYQTYYFYPKKAITSANYYTYWRVYYTFDGISYTSYLYR
ncbi:triple tyrosine motif-containing protein [Bacillus rubiinfantis]|uniref:triple tyrosine motif-containing protein n=1 Tax=Bacillus rubiinfantis TaxID=1499680 RepID=UPI0005A6999B|nr:triple tyrosine motif-containing protein [Bacillus rubiinfantis]